MPTRGTKRKIRGMERSLHTPDLGRPQNGVRSALIKKKELARRLSVSTRSIDTWVGKRMIPYIQTTPRFYLYDSEPVLAAVRKHYQVDAAQG